MIRTSLKLLAPIFVTLALTSGGAAQTIQYSNKPDPRPEPGQCVKHTYTVSYSRRNAPSVFELSGWGLSDEQKAQRIQNLINWNNTIPSSSSWRLAVILVEREGEISTTGCGGVRDVCHLVYYWELDWRWDSLNRRWVSYVRYAGSQVFRSAESADRSIQNWMSIKPNYRWGKIVNRYYC